MIKLTLSGLGGGHIAPQTYDRLSVKTIQASNLNLADYFLRFIYSYFDFKQKKTIVMRTLTANAKRPVKKCCAYFGHIYILLSIIHILSY